MKKFALISVFMAVVVIFGACGSSSYSSSQYSASSAAPAASASAARSPDYGIAGEGGFESEEIAVNTDVTAVEDEVLEYVPSSDNNMDVPSYQPSANAERMIITTVDLGIETTDFDSGVEEILSYIEGSGGFVQDSYVQGQCMFAEGKGTRSASFTARIPSERLDAFINGVGGIFIITSKQQSGQDITDSYYDTESRLRSLKIQETRLLAMMENAADLEYLLEVQARLAEVQYEIDNYTSSKMRMENQVAMSTVYINLSEVVEYTPVVPTPVTFGERISDAVSGSFDSFTDSVQNFILLIIWMAPFLITLALVAAAILFIIFRKRNKAGLSKSPAISDVLPTRKTSQEEKDE